MRIEIHPSLIDIRHLNALGQESCAGVLVFVEHASGQPHARVRRHNLLHRE